jgi:hypothetical protein
MSARLKLIQPDANHSGRPSMRRQRASSSPGCSRSRASAAAKSPLKAVSAEIEVRGDRPAAGVIVAQR